MNLNCVYQLNTLKDRTEDLDRATARVGQYWNDRVSEAIDAEYVNRIVDCCQRAITEIQTNVSRADYIYQRLYALGR